MNTEIVQINDSINSVKVYTESELVYEEHFTNQYINQMIVNEFDDMLELDYGIAFTFT
jgi:hypothetical protein